MRYLKAFMARSLDCRSGWQPVRAGFGNAI